MHFLQKAYCRIFQTAFRIAQPFLPYRTPHRLQSISDIPSTLHSMHVHSVLLVTDPGLFAAGLTLPLQKMLESSRIRCIVYAQTRANPTVENVQNAHSIYLREHCQSLIAFGGGSPMDCAKAVGALIVRPRKKLQQLKGLLRIRRRLPPLIAIPTTAGTGSEVTVTAVITDSKSRHKYTMNDFSLIPSHAVLDPQTTCSLPAHLTATTGMDALTHAVEAYIGRSTNRETRRLSLEAVRLIFENIETAYHDGQHLPAREKMLLASHLAGISFSKSYVGYVHAIAHSLGGQYNTPHGLANAVLLPIVLQSYGSAVYKKLHQLGVAAGVCHEQDSDEEGAKLLIHAICLLNDRMGIPRKLNVIRTEDIEHMARYAAHEANPLYPVPVLMDAKELKEIYLKAAKGEHLA